MIDEQRAWEFEPKTIVKFKLRDKRSEDIRADKMEMTANGMYYELTREGKHVGRVLCDEVVSWKTSQPISPIGARVVG